MVGYALIRAAFIGLGVARSLLPKTRNMLSVLCRRIIPRTDARIECAYMATCSSILCRQMLRLDLVEGFRGNKTETIRTGRNQMKRLLACTIAILFLLVSSVEATIAPFVVRYSQCDNGRCTTA